MQLNAENKVYLVYRNGHVVMVFADKEEAHHWCIDDRIDEGTDDYEVVAFTVAA